MPKQKTKGKAVTNNTISDNSLNTRLNPWNVTGLSDGEGSFQISIYRPATKRPGWRVKIKFSIELHRLNAPLLYKVRDFFGVGEVREVNNTNKYIYRVGSQQDMQRIISHFNKYPLQTKKGQDFDLFKTAFSMIIRGEHLNSKGVQEIVNIKASMNFERLSEMLREAFPDTKPVNRPVRNKITRLDPDWIAGFVEGEGSFSIEIYKRSDTRLKVGVKPIFKITQNGVDEALLNRFKEIFKCGSVYAQSKDPKYKAKDYMTTSLKDITANVIPFFLSHPLQGDKKDSFDKYQQVIALMQQKAHLNEKGLEEIRKLREGMNPY